MRRQSQWLARGAVLLLAALLALPGWGREPSSWRWPGQRIESVELAALPKEAQQTLELIKRGGPFPYRKDGTVFQNRERRLPSQPGGYYREYTVRTPGESDRGARRIVAGRGPAGDVRNSGEYYYTPDHYRSFRRIRE
jgi:ribonuclease T1